MVWNRSSMRHQGEDARGSRILALVLSFALALAGSSAVVLPATVTLAGAEELSAAADSQQQVTFSVIGPDENGSPTYYLAPYVYGLDASKTQSGWDVMSAAFREAGIKVDVSGSGVDLFVNGIGNPETGEILEHEPWSKPNYKYWILYVNGKASDLGIYSVELKPGDSVVWYYGSSTYDATTGVSTYPALPAADTISEASVPMYRLFNPYSGEHLFTESREEVDSLVPLGWRDEGTGWQAAERSSAAVYRLYNPYNGEHLYTTNKSEYDSLQADGWRGEGVKAYSDGARGVAVYRLYNPYVQVGTHLYTTDKSEYDHLQTLGWRGENVALYGVK